MFIVADLVSLKHGYCWMTNIAGAHMSNNPNPLLYKITQHFPKLDFTIAVYKPVFLDVLVYSCKPVFLVWL